MLDYSFTIHYKSGVENVVADTFSKLSIRDAKDLEAYSQLRYVDDVKAIFDGVVNQSCNGETWIPKVNVVHSNMENLENKILYEGGKAKEFFAAADISKAQMEIGPIAKLIQLNREGIALNTSERSKESKEVPMFLGDTDIMLTSNKYFSQKN